MLHKICRAWKPSIAALRLIRGLSKFFIEPETPETRQILLKCFSKTAKVIQTNFTFLDFWTRGERFEQRIDKTFKIFAILEQSSRFVTCRLF